MDLLLFIQTRSLDLECIDVSTFHIVLRCFILNSTSWRGTAISFINCITGWLLLKSRKIWVSSCGGGVFDFNDLRSQTGDGYLVLIWDSWIEFEISISPWISLVPLRITTRLVLLWLLATVRCIFFLTEQPLTSCMTNYPYITWFQGVIGKLYAWRFVTLSWAKLS